MMMLMTSFAMAEDVLQVVPFSTKAGITNDDYTETFSLNLVCTQEYKAVQFDIYLPDGLTLLEDFPADFGELCPIVKQGPKLVQQHDLSVTDKGNGHYFAEIHPIAAATKETFNEGNGTLMYFYYKTSSDIAPGVYPIYIKGLILGVDGNATTGVYPDNSVSYVTITDSEGKVPTNNVLLDLGNYLVPSFVESTLPEKNVIKDGTCANLVLTDGADFSAPTEFTATSATYTREMANKWGTIVLPYDVKSNENVAYYLPETVENDVLKLTKVETLPANTPALVAKLKGDGITSNGANVTVKTENNTFDGGNVTMHGSYVNDTKVTDANAYYIKENQFWLNNENFYIDAFRSYFTVSTSGSAKSLRISEGTVTALSALTGEGDVKVEAFYDESGKQQDGLRKGLNIMKMSNGKSLKVLIQ